MCRFEHVPGEAEIPQHILPEVLHDDVGLLHELQEDLASSFALEVERHAALVDVQHEERVAAAGWGNVMAPQNLAAGRLDLDDIGALCGQQQAAVRPVVDLAEFEHPKAGEGLCVHAASESTRRSSGGAKKVATTTRKAPNPNPEESVPSKRA